MLKDPGTLIQCDSSIKAIIVKINAEHKNDIIIEDIDDEHVLIKTEKHQLLKQLLDEVGRSGLCFSVQGLTIIADTSERSQGGQRI